LFTNVGKTISMGNHNTLFTNEGQPLRIEKTT
jgi:hypothetical protein